MDIVIFTQANEFKILNFMIFSIIYVIKYTLRRKR